MTSCLPVRLLLLGQLSSIARSGTAEQQLVPDLGDQLELFVTAVGCDLSPEVDDLANLLHEKAQPRLFALIAERVRTEDSLVQYLPAAFRVAINDLRELT